jgi:zinc protease
MMQRSNGQRVMRRLGAAFLLLAAGCASGRVAPADMQQAPDRTARPAVAVAPDLVLPSIQRFTLDNGLRVVLMEKRDLPLVQLNLLLDAGSVFDPADRAGLASLTAAMLDEGAAGMSSLEIADAFEMLGARFGIGAGTHSATMTLRAPTARVPDALQLAARVLLQPEFPQHELERLRTERITALVRRHDDPNAIASTLFDATLFGPDHPYGRSGFGTDASLRALTTDELRRFHQRFYRPNNATAIVVGDIDAATARELLVKTLGRWERGDAPRATVPAAPQVRGRVVYIVDKPGSAQSVVRLGRIGVPRTTADYYALQVMNVVLGGSFTSRLNQNLREDKGYAYGASSGFGFLPAPGPWFAASSVQTHSTGPALAEFINELRGMHRPIPEEEVARARNFLAMRYPAGFQSVAEIAGQLAEIVQYDLPPDYFNHYVDNVLAVTKADVERVAQQYLDPDNVAIFVVGDRNVIEDQVRAQNLGDIRFLSVVDVLGPLPQGL